MIKIEFPGKKSIVIENIVFDFNGTLAVGGIIEPRIIEALNALVTEQGIQVYVLTADTYGTVTKQLTASKVTVKIVSQENGSADKANFVNQLGANTCAAVGNGFNDITMLQQARLSICIMGPEGCAGKALLVSDIVVGCIEDALSLFNNPLRIKATLRQ